MGDVVVVGGDVVVAVVINIVVVVIIDDSLGSAAWVVDGQVGAEMRDVVDEVLEEVMGVEGVEATASAAKEIVDGGSLSSGSIFPHSMNANALWDKTRSFLDINNSLSHERGSERSERASERMSAAEGASKASSPEQANE